MRYIFTLSSKSLTMFVDGQPYSIDANHPNWDRLNELIRNPAAAPLTNDDLLELLSIRHTLLKSLSGRVTLTDGDTITIDGVATHSYVARKIDSFALSGLDPLPWLNFLDKLSQNPSSHVYNELFQWLEQANMPITPTGNFLAYKRVDSGLRSYHASPDGMHLQHEIGVRLEMPRREVDDVRDNYCSTGLHFCAWDYLSSYNAGCGHILVLEIDPKDVVTIPGDYNFQKGRACAYTPIRVLEPVEVHPYRGQELTAPEGMTVPELREHHPEGGVFRCLNDGYRFTSGELYYFNGDVLFDDDGDPREDSWEAQFTLVPQEHLVFQDISTTGAEDGDQVQCLAVDSDIVPYKPGEIYKISNSYLWVDGSWYLGNRGCWKILK